MDEQNKSIGDIKMIPKLIPNYIGGEMCPALGGEAFQKISPHSGKEICKVARSRTADIKKAVEDAKKAQPKWAEFAAVGRGDLVREIALNMMKRAFQKSIIIRLHHSAHSAHPWIHRRHR